MRIMEETLRSHLHLLATRYAETLGVSVASVGKAALRDNTFFQRIEAGEGFTIRTFDRALQWFSDNWPSDTPWPSDIPRPAPAAQEAAA